MNKNILLYFALLMWFVVPISAQPTIFGPTKNVEPGATVSVDFKVVDFVDVQTMQFSVRWNPAVLEFISVNDFSALPDYELINFGTDAADSGSLTTYWVDPDFASQTLADSTALFSVLFDVVGSSDSFSLVEIANDPLAIELSNSAGDILLVNTINGMITVDNPLALNPEIAVQSNKSFTLFQNEPNPFNRQSNIRFDLKQDDEVAFRFYTINGKLVYSFKKHFLEGANSITIDADKLSGAGTYFYTMQTDEYSLTNKMILVR